MTDLTREQLEAMIDPDGDDHGMQCHLARQLLATLDALAAAQAAQAVVVERAADRLNDLTFWTGDDDRGTTLVALQEARTAIRSLADPTGVKLLAAEQSTPPITPDADTAAIRHHERFGPLDEHGNPLDPRRRW